MTAKFEYRQDGAGNAEGGLGAVRLERAANPYTASGLPPKPVDDAGVALMIFLCAGALLISWALLIATLLYVVSVYSVTTWILISLGLALGHGMLAAVCWRCASPFRRA